MKKSYQLSAISYQLIYLSCLWSLVFCLWPILCFAQEQDPPLSYYEIIEQRNFFRPTQEVTVEEKQQESKKIYTPSEYSVNVTDLILTGIVRIKGEFKAIIEKQSGGDGFYIAINDSVQDYTVKDIQEDKIILEKNNQEFVLRLKKVSSHNDRKSENELQQSPSQKKQVPQRAEPAFESNVIKRLRTGKGKNEK